MEEGKVYGMLLITLGVVSLCTSGVAQAQDLLWEPTAVDTSVHVTMLYVTTEDVLFAGTEDVLMRSFDAGASWERVGPPGVNDLAEMDGLLLAAGREGVHRSTDGGRTWSEVLPKPLLDECGDHLQFTFAERVGENELLVGAIEEDGGSGGCKIRGRLYWSYDLGISWTHRTISDPQDAVTDEDGTLYYGDFDGRILSLPEDRSGQGAIVIEGLGAPVTALHFNASGTLYAGTGHLVEYPQDIGTGIYRSSDGGETWEVINNGLTDLTIKDIASYTHRTVLATTLEAGVFRTSDGGDSWEAVSDGLPSLNTTALVVTSDGIPFVGTDEGIYRSTRSVAIATEPGPEMPAQVTLLPNYPNPFNRQTVIPFRLATTMHVRLSVHDLLGREVAVLVDRVYSPGSHEVSFTADGHSSGVYVYELRAGAERGRHRMLLLR